MNKPPAEMSGYHNGIKHYRTHDDAFLRTRPQERLVAFKGALGSLNSVTPTKNLTKMIKRRFGVVKRKGQ